MSDGNAGNVVGRRRQAQRRWAIRDESPPTVAFTVAVDLLAALATVVLLLAAPRGGPAAADVTLRPPGFDRSGWTTPAVAILLVASGVAFAEFARVVERARRVISQGHAFSTNVLALTATLVLPLRWSIPVILVLQLHVWHRAWRKKTPLYRAIFSTASIELAAVAAVAAGYAVARVIGAGLLSDLAGLVAFAVVNQGLVTIVLIISNPQSRWTVHIGSFDDNVLELATLFLGVLTAAAMVLHPLLVWLVAIPVIVLGRAALVQELHSVAQTDSKTGLLNSGAWHARAETLLAPGIRTRRHHRPARGPVLGVLMCDLDHFKRVNDGFGHLVGDRVLSEVAEVLRSVVRDSDVVGRWGGEEFVVLIVDDGDLSTAAKEVVAAVAERIRAGVAAMRVPVVTPEGPLTLGLTISIGAVTIEPSRPRCERTTPGLAGLLDAADDAAYAAKAAGRDQVLNRSVGGRAPSRQVTE